MRTKCEYCGTEVEVDIDGFVDGEELQTTCPECGRDFVFTVKTDSSILPCYYYLDKNNEQAGPISIDALCNVISNKTLVWKDGFKDWTKAEDVPELRSKIDEITPPPIPKPVQVIDTPQPEDIEDDSCQPPKPDNNMLMAILSTLFCCIPTGVYAIYCASKVDGLYYQGDYYEADNYAEKAKSWTYWGIGIGIAFDLLYYMFL